MSSTIETNHIPPTKTKKSLLRQIIFGLAALLVIIEIIIKVQPVIYNHLSTKHWGVVEQGLIYRSGRLPLDRAKTVLAKYHIRVLIDLTNQNPGNRYLPNERAAAKALGIECHNFPLLGNGTGDITYYANAIAVMHQARDEGKPVLVHCVAGTQRTGGVVAAYQVLVERKSPEEACTELRHYGWNPNTNQELLIYLNQNMKKLADLLLELQVIDTIPDPLPVITCN
jgi:protein tyrosine/serine phosphatase